MFDSKAYIIQQIAVLLKGFDSDTIEAIYLTLYRMNKQKNRSNVYELPRRNKKVDR